MDAELRSLIEDALQRYTRERYSAAQLLARLREGDTATAGRTREMANLGWFELLRDEEGRCARSVLPLLPLFRAAGEGLWQEPLYALLGAAAFIAGQTQSAALREHLVEGLIAGSRPLAYAVREAGDGWNPGTARTIARTQGGTIRLEGEKIAIADAAVCAGVIVSARDAASGDPAFYFVAFDAPGLHWQHVRGVDGRGLADLRLSDAVADYLCSGERAALAAAWDTLLSTAEAIGLMRCANRDTVDYLRERRQFGRSLLEFQALQHRLVEMHMLERETDALLQSVAEDHDAGDASITRRLWVLRALASRALRQVTAEAVQMHGGMGVTQDVRVSHAYRRALMIDSLHGSEDWALGQLSGSSP